MPYPVNQPFTDAYKATRIIEALENYAVADQLADSPKTIRQQLAHWFASHGMKFKGSLTPKLEFSNEQSFWKSVLHNPYEMLGKPVTLNHFVLSDWVPRVPGLFWQEKAWRLRQSIYDGRRVYPPDLKSAFVATGIGTNLFAPDPNGQRIAAVVSRISFNASTGIPILIPNGIWKILSMEPGIILDLRRVSWQPMTSGWAQRFESVAGIPRAYLCIEDESQIRITDRGAPPSCEPYSILEYVKENALLYDFVFHINRYNNYVSSDRVTDFFEDYRVNFGYNGRYLLNPDPANPIFEDAYSSPEQLRSAEPGSRYHLNVLRKRVRQAYFNGQKAEDIIQVLSLCYTNISNIRRIATYLKYPVVQFATGRPADCITQLVDWCMDNQGKMEELIDKIATENPDQLVVGTGKWSGAAQAE